MCQTYKIIQTHRKSEFSVADKVADEQIDAWIWNDLRRRFELPNIKEVTHM